jgi:glycosyltransferase involved in cell wall biosynthesis
MELRVLHLGKFFPPARGGMEVFLADLVESQRAQGISSFALVHGDPLAGDPDWLTRVPVQGHISFAPVAVGFRSALRRAIERHRPDVLHLHMPNNAVFWALTVASARALPWIVHWHADVVFSPERKMLALAYRLYRPFEQAVLQRADRIVATSPPYLAASEALARWHAKCSVVPLGLQPVVADFGEDRAEVLPWRPGRLRLLSIGRLTYYKGFETLIRAIAPLVDIDLIIAGTGELHSDLQRLIDDTAPAGQEPSVRLLGDVSDILKHQLLQSCDTFCLASRERTEAFGMVLLEAMLHARPCLVSDLPGSGMPWLVRQTQCGELVELDNEKAWRDAVARRASNREEGVRQGKAGQHALKHRFSTYACVRNLTCHYESLVGRTPDSRQSDDVLIVIPARDEGRTITPLVRSLREAGWNHVLVIDDNSSDDTSTAAESAGARVLRPVLPMGAWGAMQSGIRWAQARGYQAVVTMDADGQHEVSGIPQLLKMRDHTDVVVGAFAERASPARRIAWRWFIHLTGLDLEDLTSGFRYYNSAAMAVVASEEATLLDYQDLGTLLMLRKAGLRTVEVPVAMKLRAVGKSRIFNSWLSVGRYMALTTLLCLSRWDIGKDRAT